jgi:hypothetical protein
MPSSIVGAGTELSAFKSRRNVKVVLFEVVSYFFVEPVFLARAQPTHAAAMTVQDLALG